MFRFTQEVEMGRVTDRSQWGQYASDRGAPHGMFFLRCPATKAEIKVIATSGDDRHLPWEHVSASLKHRCPTWDEMSWLKQLFWEDDDCVVQFHPPKSEHVNVHPNCLHLWRPKQLEVPRPPVEMV